MERPMPAAAVDATPDRRRGWRAEVVPLLSLATPLVIGLAASTLIGVTDTLMVAPLGETALAAVSLTSSVILIFYATVYGALSMLGVEVANAHGARTPRRISGIVRNGLVLGLIVGAAGTGLMAAILPLMDRAGQPPEVVAAMGAYWLCMAALIIPFALLTVLKQMFEAIDRPWTGVAFAFLGVIVNIPLNYALIYGAWGAPELGLTGAGVASLVAETVSFLAAWIYWRRARSTRRLRTRAPVTAGAVSQQARSGAPLGLMYAGETGAYALAGVMLGWIGATALAANQVVNAVGSVLYMLPLGMAGAVAIRVSQASGAGELDRLRPIAGAAMGLVTVWMLGSAAVLGLAGEAIARAIVDDPEVVAVAAGLFFVVALMQVGDGLQSTGLGALRGLGDIGFASVVSLLTYWLLSLPLAYVLAFPMGWGVTGIWAGFGAGLAVAAVALPLRFFARTRPEAARTI
jgi:multidrug resistance protein, MATE family